MPILAPRDDLVLVLSNEMLEAADIADFAESRSLGQVVVENDTGRAHRLLSENRFSVAFIGLPESEDRETLLSVLKARHTHIILINDDPFTVRGAGIRVLSRPFWEMDLECAFSKCRSPMDVGNSLERDAAPNRQNDRNQGAA